MSFWCMYVTAETTYAHPIAVRYIWNPHQSDYLGCVKARSVLGKALFALQVKEQLTP